ncbi:MAG TPA: FliM/FliN family flagellar motor switch protein [Solirubrobacteraceae bacterium]|jgi:flagellar motor switch protein FliM|nr:FliM/FliN family flagellar motor switch protein [Solirubrobacteraceae bacterium]
MSVSQDDKQDDVAAEVDEPALEAAVEQIRALDFSQPTKFTTELRRRILRSLETFSEALASWLGSELNSEVYLSVGDVSQHTWAAAKAQLPADSIAVAVHADTIERHMLMSIERPLVLQALECLLGGEASHAPAERHLTEIDWVLTRGVLDGIVRQLSVAWDELGGPPLSRGDVDTEGDAGVLTPIGEPTLSLTFDVKIDGLGSRMALLIPWGAIEPIMERIRGNGAESLGADPRGADALHRGVAGAQVLLRAEVGSVQMPIERMLELTPGALVELEDRAEDGVLLFAEGVSLGRGRPGRSGARRAVKLTATGEPPVRADTYAKLGRAELERARAHLHETRERPEDRAILRSIFVRVWAELGRTHLPLGESLELAQGVVVELDQRAEAPVELFANGLCFASGSLVVTGEGAWGVQLAELIQ